MSRLIVKNLPKTVTEEKLRDLFGEKGLITDLKLKYTQNGVFRGFAFVGYKNEANAEEARKFFDNTYVGLSRIKVETCADIGSGSKPRSWSKYSKDSSIYQKSVETKTKSKESKTKDVSNVKEKQAKPIKELETYEKLKEDPKFAEFLELNKRKNEKNVWSNDAAVLQDDDQAENVEFDDSESDNENEEEEEADAEKPVVGKKQSDLDYLKSKMMKPKDQQHEVGDEMDDVKIKSSESDVKVNKERDSSFTVVLRNLHCKCKKRDIKNFFDGLKPKEIRLPRTKGLAFVQFKSKKDVQKALIKHKSFLGGHSIEVTSYKSKVEDEKKESEKVAKWEKNAKELENEETIAESGRLFVRNLSYTVTEEEIENHFKKYGPLADCNLPIDKFTRKVKGFAHVTFVVPENAVRAFTEEDGKCFQGRMLHILPGKAPVDKDKITDDMTFKEKKELTEKKMSSSDHNWNTLFLGTNAIADAMAERYNVKKSKILDPESTQSLAVRMALGETQLITETRNFLMENNVHLDVFGQAVTKRSNTVILVKNLPAKTPATVLRDLFSEHGELGRVLMPPHGITAIVEFVEPTEAKAAFRSLAYTKFQHTPLYLEWAPVDMFSTPLTKQPEKNEETVKEETKESSETKNAKTGEESEVDDEDDEPEPDTTIFVKNLNFDTTDDSLHKHFSTCGALHYATVSKKKNFKESGDSMLSMGFGFIQFMERESAQKALKELQHSKLDGHRLELKLSNRTTNSPTKTSRKKAKVTTQKTTKILIRNIPFQAKVREVRELFSTFGELKSIRLPQKSDASGNHRGFGFVDFFTRHDAKRAFQALCQSTHLLGRRLVLEWAEPEQTVDDLRKRTAQHFRHDTQGNIKRMKKSNADVSEMMATSDQEDN